MGTALDETHGAASGAERLSLLPLSCIEIVDRQTLTLGFLNLSAAMADCKFLRGHPIRDRTAVAENASGPIIDWRLLQE